MSAEQNDNVILKVEALQKHFPVSGGLLNWGRTVVKAVDGVSFHINEGETLGLVGESGCGKSTTGRVVLRLHEPTGGRIWFEGDDVTAMSSQALKAIRPKMQMIFQDSAASLNPRHSIGKIIAEPLKVHTDMTEVERHDRVSELMQLVGLNPNWRKRFPHEFSGGQRQRINIARALALNPRFIVADEPISALDVSIQAQVVNLMQDLQRQLGLTYLFIAHDLSMVRHISNRIAVMYLGKMVEIGRADDMFRDPLHPYTQSLISAVPIPNPKQERVRQPIILEGEVPSPRNVPSGCVFHTRCPIAQPICRQEIPPLQTFRPGSEVACHLVDAQESHKLV